ncbi:hypothetical protein [Saccharothrix texasensis]|uniref:Uncharacterized protein n=1 Tax=Saccharothrix texasensis TaxID=103734 RepID=A0A3N1GYK0_9PSEU|nr:hypothetical protein [Saccharothrix texasensis]ROP35403.1 hypothetical protein EDD40_0632 [Saccharothrix texasensis]
MRNHNPPFGGWRGGTPADELDHAMSRGTAHRGGVGLFLPVPVPVLPPSTALADLATAGEHHAWLAGTTGVFTSRPSTPLVLSWTGETWREEPLPDLPAPASLSGVSAAAPDDVWAVGNSAGRPLVLHYDGTTWHVVPTPPITWAKAVTAVARDDVHVVGTGRDALHYDGVRWRRRTALSSARETLHTITATGRHHVWAGGGGLAGAGPATYEYPVLVHWDGATWTEIPGPRAERGHVARLAATAPDDVWLGQARDTDGLRVHRWDGHQWTTVPTPGDPDRLSLHGVAAGWTWGVRATRGSFETRPAYHRWTDTGWTPVALPDDLALASASHVGLATTGATTWAYLKTAAGVHVLRHTLP